MYLIAGFVADTCVERLKITRVNIVLLMVAAVFNMLLILLKKYLLATAENIFEICTAGLQYIGDSCYLACLFPNIADQLIGVSGEQLSFAVYWTMWGFTVACYINNINILQLIPSDYCDIVVETVCVSMMVLICICCKNSLTSVPQPVNPYKLIFQGFQLC